MDTMAMCMDIDAKLGGSVDILAKYPLISWKNHLKWNPLAATSLHFRLPTYMLRHS